MGHKVNFNKNIYIYIITPKILTAQLISDIAITISLPTPMSIPSLLVVGVTVSLYTCIQFEKKGQFEIRGMALYIFTASKIGLV